MGKTHSGCFAELLGSMTALSRYCEPEWKALLLDQGKVLFAIHGWLSASMANAGFGLKDWLLMLSWNCSLVFIKNQEHWEGWNVCHSVHRNGNGVSTTMFAWLKRVVANAGQWCQLLSFYSVLVGKLRDQLGSIGQREIQITSWLHYIIRGAYVRESWVWSRLSRFACIVLVDGSRSQPPQRKR